MIQLFEIDYRAFFLYINYLMMMKILKKTNNQKKKNSIYNLYYISEP